MKHIAHYLLEVAQSNYWKPREWQAWADNLIMNSSEPDSWILQVSTAKNVNELWQVLNDQYLNERSQHGFSIGLSEAIIGYYYLEFEANQITLREFLSLAGREADAGETEVTSESIYGILNEVEILLNKGDTNGQVEVEVLRKVKNLLHDYKLIALSHLSIINTFTGKSE
jgi:hypothetical protein